MDIFKIEKINGVLTDILYTEQLQQLTNEELEQVMEKGEYIEKEALEVLKEKANGKA